MAAKPQQTPRLVYDIPGMWALPQEDQDEILAMMKERARKRDERLRAASSSLPLSKDHPVRPA